MLSCKVIVNFFNHYYFDLASTIFSGEPFTLSEDGNSIRANQGHSVRVDLDLEPKMPPDVLYHGTAHQFLDSIREKGLLKGQRNHVHLSEEKKTAKNVGGRHGRPVILQIKSG